MANGFGAGHHHKGYNSQVLKAGITVLAFHFAQSDNVGIMKH